ncbi:MAG: NAD(P)/FAD-dependent oxidoreductase [Myxococcota bacterium]
MAQQNVDSVVVGAGVVGLAIARALARAGHAPIVIERERAIAQHQSSRNSEVLHAGIYYPPGSLKAQLCRVGVRRLYRFLHDRGLPYRRCGKLIVATQAGEQDVLEAIVANAAANDVDDLAMQSAAQARALEPNLSCAAAALSPTTGVLSSHDLVARLRAEAEDHGGSVALATDVVGIEPEPGGTWLVHAESAAAQPRELVTLRTPYLVNAAGLGAQALAQTIPPDAAPSLRIPARYLTKGTYFAVAGRPFSRLVYPTPDTASLGIHVTIDMAGEVRFGPDQEWVDAVDYTLDPARAEAFVPAIRRYYPGLRPEALTPAYVGVRSKVQAPGTPMADFVVDGPHAHGIAGLVNLFGIESPGLTACLALADSVVRRLGLVPRPDPD